MVKEEMAALGSRLGEFISLKASVNTSDSKTNDMGHVMTVSQQIRQQQTLHFASM